MRLCVHVVQNYHHYHLPYLKIKFKNQNKIDVRKSGILHFS